MRADSASSRERKQRDREHARTHDANAILRLINSSRLETLERLSGGAFPEYLPVDGRRISPRGGNDLALDTGLGET